MYVCIFIHVCMYVCMYVCIYICIHIENYSCLPRCKNMQNTCADSLGTTQNTDTLNALDKSDQRCSLMLLSCVSQSQDIIQSVNGYGVLRTCPREWAAQIRIGEKNLVADPARDLALNSSMWPRHYLCRSGHMS